MMQFRDLFVLHPSRYSDPAAIRAALLMNKFIYASLVITFASIVFSLGINQSGISLYYAPPVFTFLLLTLFLNNRGYVIAGTVLIFIFANALLMVFTVAQGLPGLAFLYFFPAILVLMFLLPGDKYKGIFYFLFLLTLLSCIGSIYSAAYYGPPDLEIFSKSRTTAPYVNSFLALCLTAYIVITFMGMMVRREKSLQQMIGEKQTLLSEVHHRVKNNLAIISSLLNLQKNSVEDSAVQRALDDSRNRIYTMALIHEKLYRNQTFSSISFLEYAESLLHEYTRSSLKTRVVSNVEIRGISLVLGQAIPCGLILNELITNSIKHGFKNLKEGRISLEMKKQGGKILMNYHDNGSGVADIIGMKEKETLGMTIIQSLTEQLGGTLQFSNEEGLRFQLQFPQEFERELPV